MENLLVLPIEVEECLTEFKNGFFEKEKLNASFPNPLLQDNVLELLDKYCCVIYFPLEHEKNNGFHIKDMPFANGKNKEFVFINTEQTMEKQVFTAAHELGHIWKVDEYILDKFPNFEDTEEIREDIVNRFAACILMPKDQFEASFNSRVAELQSEPGKITFDNLIKLIVILMNQFFVPSKAVIIRLLELGYIKKDTAETLLGHDDVSDNIVNKTIDKWITYFDYTKLQKPSRKKWIDGLPELLDNAEKSGRVDMNKIEHLRQLFKLKTNETVEEINEEFSIET